MPGMAQRQSIGFFGALPAECLSMARHHCLCDFDYLATNGQKAAESSPARTAR